MQIVDRPVCGGKRIRGVQSIGLAGPRITIVTAVFNGISSLEATIQSVVAQTYANVEYIVVDGGSTDGTVDLIREYDDQIDFWISEGDQGVYDAFNKACQYITGDWTLFLGAGDTLYGPDVLGSIAQVLQRASSETELVYGRVKVGGGVQDRAELFNRPWPEMEGKWEGGRPMMPHHQGVFHHRKLLAGRQPFDTSYRIVADSKLIYESISRSEPMFCDAVVSFAPLGGISTNPKHFLSLAHEILGVNRELEFRNYRRQFWFYSKAVCKALLYRFAGETNSKKLIDHYRVFTGRERKWS